jgi:hypothetical protein
VEKIETAIGWIGDEFVYLLPQEFFVLTFLPHCQQSSQERLHHEIGKYPMSGVESDEIGISANNNGHPGRK